MARRRAILLFFLIADAKCKNSLTMRNLQRNKIIIIMSQSFEECEASLGLEANDDAADGAEPQVLFSFLFYYFAPTMIFIFMLLYDSRCVVAE